MTALTPNDAMRWRTAGSLALSPDGKQIAFTETWSDPDRNENRSAIFLVPADGSRPARQITSGPKRDWSARWSPDGRYLAFLSIRETEWRADLYVLDMRGGDAQLVVKLPRSVAEYAWSRDGSRFALTGRPAYPDDRFRPTDDDDERRKRYGERVVYTERMHYRADGNRLVDDEEPWLWVAAPGEDARVVLENEFPLNSPGWLPDGRVCFLSSREPDQELTWHSQLWAVSCDGGEPERLTDSDGQVGGYAITDGGSVVTVAYPVPGLPVGCYDDQLFVDGKRVYPDLGMNIGKHVLADTIDPVASGTTPTTDGEDVWFHASHHGAVGVYRNGEQILGGNRVIGDFVVANGVLVFMHTSPDDPATIRVANTDGSDERVVHEPNPWLVQRREWREIWVERDGVNAQAWIMAPAEGPTESPPAVINLHGGPHGAYGWAYNLLVQLQAAPEWAVMICNPPGSLTYGEEFSQLTHKAWGEADCPFVMAFCDAAAEDKRADAERLAVAGGSYGGFLTCWAIGHTDRFVAACAQRPPTKLDSIFGSSEFGWALMHSCFGAHPWEDPDLYRRLSPVTYAESINTPLRLIGCTEDYRVPMEQVEQLYITLKVLGRPVDLVVFRESHHLVYGGKPWSRAGHAQAVREWLERYL